MTIHPSSVDPNFIIADIGDRVASGIHVGDRVADARWISNIYPDPTDDYQKNRVVVTALSPSNWEEDAPAHGQWTPVNRVKVITPRVTKKEIAEAFGISPKKVP